MRADGLCKRYLIGHQSKGERFRDSGCEHGSNAYNGADDSGSGARPPDDRRRSVGRVVGLQGVTFEINHGEVIGVIGAGKSTLWKIISCMTGPSAGLATINGRFGIAYLEYVRLIPVGVRCSLTLSCSRRNC